MFSMRSIPDVARVLLAVSLLMAAAVADDGAAPPPSAPAPSPDAVLLRYKLTPGAVLVYDGAEHLVSGIKTPKRTGLSDTEAPYHTTFTVLSSTPEGGARFISCTTYDPVVAKKLLDNGKDVTEEHAAETSASFGPRRSTLGLTAQDARGAEPPSTLPVEFNDALRSMLSDIEILPEEAVAPGASWTRQWRSGPVGCGARYTLDRIETVDGRRIAVCSGVLALKADDAGEATPQFEPARIALRFRLDEGIIESFECLCKYRTKGRKSEKEPFEQEVTVGNTWRLARVETLDAATLTAVVAEGESLAGAIDACEKDDQGAALAGFDAFAASHPDSRWAAAAKDEAAGLREAYPHLGTTPPEPDIAEWLNGGPHTLEALRGRVIVIDFWATWCIPCKKGVARLKQLNKELKGGGLVILGVTSYDEYQSAASLRAWIKEHAVSYVVAVDREKATAKSYQTPQPPYTLVIGKDGKVVWEGSPVDLDRLEAAVRRACGPPAATPPPGEEGR